MNIFYKLFGDSPSFLCGWISNGLLAEILKRNLRQLGYVTVGMCFEGFVPRTELLRVFEREYANEKT